MVRRRSTCVVRREFVLSSNKYFHTSKSYENECYRSLRNFFKSIPSIKSLWATIHHDDPNEIQYSTGHAIFSSGIFTRKHPYNHLDFPQIQRQPLATSYPAPSRRDHHPSPPSIYVPKHRQDSKIRRESILSIPSGNPRFASASHPYVTQNLELSRENSSHCISRRGGGARRQRACVPPRDRKLGEDRESASNEIDFPLMSSRWSDTHARTRARDQAPRGRPMNKKVCCRASTVFEVSIQRPNRVATFHPSV